LLTKHHIIGQNKPGGNTSRLWITYTFTLPVLFAVIVPFTISDVPTNTYYDIDFYLLFGT
ncbi:hypothetical protein, partial [Parabacteroides distasonis]|uniref:hypothetical protein n=1 Tax=Parabacteroides distasonis TaxID=823 RepID=UPI001C02C86E